MCPACPSLAWPRVACTDGYSFWARWVGFFILGTVNNLPYVIVGSAAKAIAGHYCALNLIGAVTWANVAMGFVAKGCNATFLLSTPYTCATLLRRCLASLGAL